MIRKLDKTRPNSLKTPLQKSTALNRQDSSPHQRHESADEDRREAPVHAEDAPHDDREGDAVGGAHLPREGDHDGADGEAEEDDRDGLARREAEGHHR